MAPPPRGDCEEIRWAIPQNVKSFPGFLRTNRCESDHALYPLNPRVAQRAVLFSEVPPQAHSMLSLVLEKR